jgi:hypothetical protein
MVVIHMKSIQITKRESICRGLIVSPSSFYRGRYNCFFFGRDGLNIKNWLRSQFGDEDDLIYADETTAGEPCESMITEEHLVIIKLKWGR